MSTAAPEHPPYVPIKPGDRLTYLQLQPYHHFVRTQPKPEKRELFQDICFNGTVPHGQPIDLLVVRVHEFTYDAGMGDYCGATFYQVVHENNLVWIDAEQFKHPPGIVRASCCPKCGTPVSAIADQALISAATKKEGAT